MSDNLGQCPLCGGEKQLGATTFADELVKKHGYSVLNCHE